MGFTFKPKLAAVLAIVNGIAAGAAYVASSGDLTTTIIALAVSVGLSAGVSYHKEQEEPQQ
jgi:uncharacterized membrane protein YoaK (UPF0700 family)